MTHVMAAAFAFVLGAELEVAAGEPLVPVLARARPGDVIRLGPGVHEATLGRPAGIRVEGAGAGVTIVSVPEGEDGAVVAGELELAGLTLRAGPERCAVKVTEDGDARLHDVALSGGGCGAFVEGRLRGRDLTLEGGYGLLVARGGDAALEGGSAQGRFAGVGVLSGAAALRRFAITGPSTEAGISVAGGSAALESVVIRSPGPSGIAVSAGGRVEGLDVTVSGAREAGGILGDCVMVIRGELRLEGATLVRCAGAALETSGGTVRLHGVDAAGGAAGCLILVNGADAELSANLCAGRGPGLVVASRSRARLVANRWWTDPLLWAECGSGVQVDVGRGEKLKPPCAPRP